MTDRPDKPTAKRRDFLRLAGLAPLAGAAALASGKRAQAAEPPPAKGVYRETAHIRKYYETARS